jgi:hypothetical protein
MAEMVWELALQMEILLHDSSYVVIQEGAWPCQFLLFLPPKFSNIKKKEIIFDL